MLHQHQGNTHQQTPRERLEELRAKQAQSGPIGGPVLAAPQIQRPTQAVPAPVAILPSERQAAGDRSQRARLEELRERQRNREVRGEMTRASLNLTTNPLALATGAVDIAGRLIAPEATPLTNRSVQLLGQGGTLGFGDELEAGARAITQPLRDLAGTGRGQSMGDAFSEQAAASRGQLEESRTAAPLTSFALEAGGGGAIAGGPITDILAGATGRGSLALRSAGVGGVTGGVVGFGEAEGEFQERLPSAAIGAGLGAGLGAVSPLVIEGITRTGTVMARVAGRGFNRLRGGERMTRDQRRAFDRIMQRVQEDGVTAEQFQGRMERARELGLEDDLIFEMAGPSLLDLARGGTAQGSEAAMKGLARVRMRQADVQSRVAADLQDAIGSDGSDFLARSQSISDARSAADPLYARFRELPGIDRTTTTPAAQQLEQFFTNPTFANAADRAALSAQTRTGQTIDLTSNVSPDVLDRIKRTLGEQIATARRQGDATQVGDLVSLQRRYVTFLDDQYPGVYKQARQAFAGPAAQEEALELGESLIRSTEARRAPEAVAQRVAEMSADELAAFRVGVARSVVNQMRTAPSPLVRTDGAPVDLGTDPANPIRRFFNTDQQRDVIRAAFGNDRSFNAFARRMAVESERAETFRQINVRQGSQTQPRQRAVERLGEGAEAAADIGMLAAGSTIPVLRTVARMLRGGRSRTSPAVQEEIQRILFSTPREQRPVIERALQEMLARETGGANAQQVSRQIIGPLLVPAEQAGERIRN